MNKKIVEAIVEEVDAVLSVPITPKGMDGAMLISSDVRSELRKILEKYLAEAPEPDSLVHQTRRR